MTKENNLPPHDAGYWWRLYYLFACLITLTISLYCLSDGSWNLKSQYFYGDVYWDMWLRLSHGDLTADRHIIHDEAHVIDGKTYAYFLPLPAFIRGLFSLIGLGQYPIPSFLTAIALFLYSSLNLYFYFVRSANLQTKEMKWLTSFLGGLLTICSPILILLTYPMMFWEAIVWGTALFMTCSLLSYRLLITPKNLKSAFLFSLLCGAALFTRPTIFVASSALFLLTFSALGFNKEFITFIKSDHRRTFKLVLAILIFLVFFVLLGLYNYMKWGAPFEFGNFKNYTLIWTSDYYNFFKQYGHFQLDRILEGFAFYFLPTVQNFTQHLPFIQAAGTNPFLGFAKQINYREAPLSFFLTLPIYEIGFFTGLFLFAYVSFKKNQENINLSINTWPIAISSLLPLMILLGWFAHSIRYMGDILPSIYFFFLITLIVILKKIDNYFLITKNRNQIKLIFICLSLLLASLSLYLEISASWVQRQAPLLKSLAYYTPLPPTHLDQKIDFSNKGNGHAYLKGLVSNGHHENGGWSIPESWGVWSNGYSAKVELPTPVFPLENKNITLELSFRAYINSEIKFQDIDIYINNKLIKKYRASNPEINQLELQLPSPDPLDPKSQMRYSIEFKFPNACSPLSLGRGNDSRILAIGIESAIFK